MLRYLITSALAFFGFMTLAAERTTIDLNGQWEFEQTSDAFPPQKFTRHIQVPGLITMADPKIEGYDKFVKKPGQVEAKEQHSLYDLDYTPRYSWYRKTIFVGKEEQGREVVISLRKSQYVTQVYVNGMDMGNSMACFTPIEFRCTGAIKYGAENTILIRLGERIWLPSEAAGGTDKEKEHYIPGIWDDVSLSFTGEMRIQRLLILPSVADKKATVKALIRNFKPAQIFYGDPMFDSVRIHVVIREKMSRKQVAEKYISVNTRRDNITEVQMELPLSAFTSWSPENPFLYTADVSLDDGKNTPDRVFKTFGMRDFNRKGRYFYLNGQPYILRGTNVTLQRFFEDPDSRDLVWNREWVKKLLTTYPKELEWNMMRICVGLVPDFWYDLADESGLMFQNEWLYWQNHGWDEEIKKEYSDWVWSDGSHPSIAIWDAINENEDAYIGNVLIPELKELDPTRVWDAGYMTGEHMYQDEMDEPHPYQSPWNMDVKEFEKNPYPLGNLDFKPSVIRNAEQSSSAQLVNEYGWIWLWRNGTPSKLTVSVYNYYLGPHSTVTQNRELQAYWLQLETEWLRSNTSLAGVLAFCYLANNYGYTGDWFVDDIKDLRPGITLGWFKHCFAPAAIFINLTDERYVKQIPAHEPGSSLVFRLAGINNKPVTTRGEVTVKILDDQGSVVTQQSIPVQLDPLVRTNILVNLKVPEKKGGYLLLSSFTPVGSNIPQLSRRFLKVGDLPRYTFFDLQPAPLK